mmetsp:Transcript_26319/g.18674  ORF Transcript_26319/g.18674 Transcript_26319/m.18674 type:complete len:234 (+) Transcript_26319:200-901(+)
MPFYLFALMVYFDNWSLGAWCYLILHGSYGVIWLSKDRITPDPLFDLPCTVLSSISSVLLILGPYCYIGFLMMSGQADQNPHPERIFVCAWLYIFGVLLMMLADAKKYYLLKERRHLMNYGLMKYTRNPNYLGEIMLYGAFAILLNRWEPWLVLSYMWGFVFMYRMTCKDYFLSKKQGWKEYTERSWILFPKINGSAPLSIIFYGVLIAVVYQIYDHGGMQASAMLLRRKFFH